MVFFVTRFGLMTLLLTLLVACGGGGGNSSAPAATTGSGSTSNWTAGSFKPASDYDAMCAEPRSGSFPDIQGTVTDENFWLRSYSNDTYLWYDEITDVDPGTVDDALEYFDLMKTFETTPSGNSKDKFHFTYDTETWEKLSQSGISAGYGIEFFRVSRVRLRRQQTLPAGPNCLRLMALILLTAAMSIPSMLLCSRRPWVSRMNLYSLI